MAKADKGATMSRLHSAARLSRTALAARLLDHGFYAGQDQIMLSLNQEDGRRPASSRPARASGRRPSPRRSTGCRRRASSTSAPPRPMRGQAHVFLTDTGRDAIQAIEKSVRKTEKQALKGLDKKDQKALSKLLGRIEANLSDAVTHEIDDEIDADE